MSTKKSAASAVFVVFFSLLATQIGYAKTLLNPIALPPFRDFRKIEITPLLNINNASNVSSFVYNHVVAQANNGKREVLDATKIPMAFVAYWCPHCERTLAMWKLHHAHFPDLVFVGYPQGTTFSQAKQRAWAEIRYFHLPVTANQVNFVIGNQQDQYVPKGFPNYVYAVGHQDKSLLGEHTWKIWHSVLPN